MHRKVHLHQMECGMCLPHLYTVYKLSSLAVLKESRATVVTMVKYRVREETTRVSSPHTIFR